MWGTRGSGSGKGKGGHDTPRSGGPVRARSGEAGAGTWVRVVVRGYASFSISSPGRFGPRVPPRGVHFFGEGGKR